ncbi:MAG: hypothetical protein ABEJ43_06995 [Haloferacaceae archaeon]
MVRLVRALARGTDDVATPAGARLFVAALALTLAGHLILNTLLDGIVVSGYGLTLTIDYATTLPVGPTVAAWLLAATWLVGSWLLVVACRAFAGSTGVLSVDDLTRDALPATLRTAIATGLGSVLVLAGFAFGVAPGVLLLAHLLFVPVFVAVDGDGLDDAAVRSWRLAAAGRVRVLALTTLAVALAVAGVVVAGAVGGGLELLVGSVFVAAVALAVVGVAVDLRRQHDQGGPGRASGRPHSAGV